MTGYCSNSPLRCENARLMTMLTHDDNCCPECGLSLVPVNNSSRSAYTEQNFLSLALGLMVLLLLILVYIDYANFV